jgi:precorrin-6B methylase 2
LLSEATLALARSASEHLYIEVEILRPASSGSKSLFAAYFRVESTSCTCGGTKMPVNWMDVSGLSFNSMLLLEEVQLSWFPGWLPEKELAIALHANPAVEWYFRSKCPQIVPWVNRVMEQGTVHFSSEPAVIRQAEIAILKSAEDLIVYAVAPEAYDAQPFLAWDSSELLSLTDFRQKTVLDIGAGTGRLAFTAASQAEVVFAVEPVWNLRRYMRQKAGSSAVTNVFPVDGIITCIPFPDHFADITMGGHVFGDNMQEEYNEVKRVTRPGGMIILLPANQDVDNDCHRFLVERGFQWSVFIEPPADRMRKYWLVVTD